MEKDTKGSLERFWKRKLRMDKKLWQLVLHTNKIRWSYGFCRRAKSSLAYAWKVFPKMKISDCLILVV